MKINEKVRKILFCLSVVIFCGAMAVLFSEVYESVKIKQEMDGLKELLNTETCTGASDATQVTTPMESSSAFGETESTSAGKESESFTETTSGTEASVPEETSKETTEAETTTEPAPVILEKYRRIYELNNAFVGWLKIDDTVIDYPVLEIEGDNDYYLTHDFYGNESKYGQIVFDYRCDFDPASTNIILHGHHMKDGSMFGSLKKYKTKSYWNTHRYIHFDTLYEEGVYEVFAVFTSKVYNQNEDVFKYYNFINAENEEEFNDYVSNVKKLAIFKTGITPKYGDKLLALSTCEYSQENGRLVVVARKLSSEEAAGLNTGSN